MRRAVRLVALSAIAAATLASHVFAGYTDAKQRFTFNPPTGWQMQVAPDGSGIVMCASPDQQAKFIVLPLALPPGSTVAQVTAAYEQFLAKVQPNLKLTVLKDTQVVVGGKPALQREYAVKEAGGEQGKVVATFVKEGDLSVTLHTSIRGDDFAKYEPAFKACIASFRLGAGGAAAVAAAAAGAGNQAAAAAIQAKINALGAALQAGILSNAEYAQKKAELEAQLQALEPRIDPATQQKLNALEAARAAGILTEAEYAAKKADVLGQRQIAADDFTPRKQGGETATGKTFSHPGGFVFWYPTGWKVEAQEGNVQLVPANPLVTNGAPMELYMVATENVAGQNVQRPDDPRLVQILDTQIRKQATALCRVGDATPVAMGKGKGVILDWEAKTPQGVVLRARVFLGLLGTQAAALVAMGLKERLEARDADLRQIFSSFGTGRPLAAPAAGQPPAFGPIVPPVQPPATPTPEPMGGLQPTPPPAGPGPPAQPVGPAAAIDAPQKGKLYHHAIGFSFWHPDGWKVAEQQEATLQLIPPDAVTKDGAPTELYFIIGEEADPDVQRADDPRVAEYLDGKVHATAPALTRVGGAQPVAMANGQGVSLVWEARAPDGSTVRAQAFVTIIKQHGVALMALGLKDRLQARDAVLRRMFASFGFAPGKRDPNLVGTWNLMSETSISNQSPFETAWTRAQAVTERKTRLAIAADGTWQRVESHHTLVGAAGVWLEDKGNDVSSGTWNADGTSLYMMGKDDSWEQYKYQVRQTPQGREVRLASGNKGTVWRGE